MAGYTRQSTADIINGSEVTAPPLTSEFNQLAASFNGTTGHAHDGSTGSAPKINLSTSLSGVLPVAHGGTGGINNLTATVTPVVTDDASLGYAVGSMWENTTTGRIYICVGNTTNAAVWRELVQVTTGNVILPSAHDTVDLGSPSVRFQDTFLSGGLSAVGNSSFGGSLNVTGLTTLGSLNATTVGVSGTTTLATVDINGGTIDGTVIGASTKASGAFTTVTTTGQATLASADINGGTLDNAVVGGSTPQAVTGTLVTATAGFSGDLAGDVDGNLTGNVVGNVTGNVEGDLTGNVIATSGMSQFNDVKISGTLNMDAGTTTSISNVADPVNSTDAATKGYVDTSVAAVLDAAPAALNTLNELAAALGDDANFSATVTSSLATKLPLSGGTMSGDVVMGSNKITGLGNPTSNQDAVSKLYADDLSATKLPLSGGTLTGTLVLGANKATSTATPTSADDLTRKGYIDTLYGSTSSAATSASEAATSATNSATSKTNAATSETNAASSATASAGAATASETAKDAALAALDSFDDLYLGHKSAAPTVDNDGDALTAGTLYFNTSTDTMSVFDGSAWATAYASLAGTLAIANNLSDVASAATARTNLDVDQAGDALAFAIALG